MWYFYAENAECFVFLQGDSSAALKSNSRTRKLYILRLVTETRQREDPQRPDLGFSLTVLGGLLIDDST